MSFNWNILKGACLEKNFVFPVGYSLPECQISAELKKSTSTDAAYSYTEGSGITTTREDPVKVKLFVPPDTLELGQYIVRIWFDFGSGRKKALTQGTLTVEA